MLDRFEFMLEETFFALRRNGMMTVSAISTAAIALFIFSGLGFAYLSLVSYMNEEQKAFELRFSLQANTKPAERTEIKRSLEKLPGVASAIFLPRDVEWKKFLAKPENARIRDDFKDLNPLADRFKVTLSDISKADSVKKSIQKLSQYLPRDGVTDETETRRFYSNLLGLVKWFGGILSIVSLITAGTLIFNTVHLAVMARKQELRIMGLVGASRSTIRGPFLMEGAIQGMVGGVLASLLLWAIAYYLWHRYGQTSSLVQTSGFSFPVGSMTIFIVGMGALLGIFSAALSVRKYLRTES